MVIRQKTHFLPMLMIAVFLAMSAGCKSANNPENPAGGYAAFESAMMNRNADGVWLTLSDDTHQLFSDVLDTLNVTVDMVDKLQPSDREEARTAIGATLLDTVHTPKELFSYIFSNENIPTEAGFRVGLKPKKITMDGEDRAIVLTDGGQKVEMVRDDDGYWRVRAPLYDMFADAFSAMEENRAQLETAINLFGAATNEDAEIARLLGEDTSKSKKVEKKDVKATE